MSPSPDFERIRRAVVREEPDRVPLCEASVDYAIQSQLLGREVAARDLEAQVEFWLKAGYDYVPLVVGMMAPGKVTRDSAISKVIEEDVLEGAAAAEDDATWNLEYSSFIEDRRDFESFPWERAARVDLGDFHAVRKMLPEGMEVIALSGKIFTLAWMMMGFGNFGVSLLTDEGLVAEVIGTIAEIQLGALDEVLEMPHVGAVWAVDDIAFGSGTMISPGALREHVFPRYRELAARCHQAGKLFFLHSDGDLLPVMEDLIELGVDALHPIDPTAMDIAQVKQSYGDRLCLIGNVSTELLRSGTPMQVEAAVKELLRSVAPGGGYCLGSGNSIPDWVSVENYRAMLDAATRHGSYPIACD